MRRLTVVESLTYQSDDGPPVIVLTQSERRIISDEQPFQKIQKVSDKWCTLNTKLMLEFIGGVSTGLLSIRHDKPTPGQVNPTADEKEANVSRVLLVKLDGLILELLPGESLRVIPNTLPEIEMCCSEGSAKSTVTLFPK